VKKHEELDEIKEML
jgi:hypothetical protein